VAVIGASGAGKSTLAKLALRFADPDAGTVRLDGHDVRDVRLRCLREHVALLPQDPQLLDASVRDNVAYARPGASDREVAAALRRAAAPELVARLHDGVGQRGRALSGGQRRRVAIARALLQDAAVLVLDEPTAGLDAPAARRLVAPLRAVMRERAVLLVTHDLLLAREADEIVVLEDGQVVERGAPAALLGAGGAYARMHGAAGLAVAA
jgi:ABC-type multidrug transport system fused ATPase/permease subunit